MKSPSKRRVILSLLLYLCFKKYRRDKDIIEASALKSLYAKNRRRKQRTPWSEVQTRICDSHFRRMFRMSRDSFNLLCLKIIDGVGERNFKSEAYIEANLQYEPLHYDLYRSIHNAHKVTSGGYISGEVKLAIALRMLAGGSSLDLAVIFDVSVSHCRKIFIDVLKDWIIKPNIGLIDIESYLKDENAMRSVSEGFSKRSNGILKGAIGAIDGWLVRITCPSESRDHVKSATTFFSRKGFYALNVQCMVDDKKKVLWAAFSNKGSSHDSTCFRTSYLYNNVLKPMQDQLFQSSYYILGDSAYAIEGFIIPPYDNAKVKSPEDAFNFYHSSARITVECAFGEIDRRWEIFWSSISYSLFNTCIICEAGMHLHNFLVDYRNSMIDPSSESSIENEIFILDQLDNNIISTAVGTDATRPRGRPTNEEIVCRMNGVNLRDQLKHELSAHNMQRPSKNIR